MRKQVLCLVSLLFLVKINSAQVVSIANARSQPLGNTVTISGIVTNGGELGTIRYIEDGTAGIAVFDVQLSAVNRGDVITVTGVLDDYFNLLEITPVTSLTINSTGNTLPPPLVLTPNQLSDANEGQLVQIDNVIFTNGGGTFTGNSNYSFTANGQPGVVRAQGSNTIAGLPIPTAAVSVVALCSQYQNTYQLIPRDGNDILASATFYFTSQPVQSNITNSGFDVNWTTNISGSTYIEYGHTPALELGILPGAGGTISHTVNISGAGASELFYVQAFSVNGTDTAYSGIKIYMTASNSTGEIKTYFNRTVNNAVANPGTNLAIRLNNLFADTLAAYINRAQQTLDIAIYNFADVNTAPIINAINNAFNGGVTVRVIADGNNTNTALALLNPSIPVLASPLSNGYFNIMHNKFAVIDADATNANLPVVWTGSTNWTDSQLNTDANDVIIIQDQSLARAYKMEFEEMWGSNTSTPNPGNAKFGQDKTDNTPHEFNVGGKRVECYFSPSDNVNNQIMNAAATANTDLYFAVMVITRFDIAYEIANRVTNYGVYAAGMVMDSANGGQTAFNIIYNVIGNRMMEYDAGSLPGILHHKYMIVDQGNTGSDPLVLTGSHNWSTSATSRNDENTVIVHDALISNQYYQEFWQRYDDNGGVSLGVLQNNPSVVYMTYPNPASSELIVRVPIAFGTGGVDKIELLDISGKTVYHNGTITHSEIKIPVSGFANGMYFLKLQSGGFSAFEKIVVTH